MQQARVIRNVALIGFMGTGKTSVGYLAASVLNFHLVDTDEMIEGRTHRRIADIFATEGEAQFRSYEKQAVAELARHSRLVIATGGGLAANAENLASLKTHSLVVCLWASADTIWQRVHHQTHRPLLHDPDPLGRIRQLLAQREPFYRQADVLISSEIRSLKEVAFQVCHQFHVARRSKPAS